MRLRIASRKSDLARIQSYSVAEKINALDPKIKIEFHFRESLGDINQADPLWKMPERGVFTEDFYQGLCEDAWDLVVHSWKDLPVAPRQGTSITATTAREDANDVFFLAKNKFSKAQENKKIRILSSSPRRVYNLQSLLPHIFPIPSMDFEFLPVRGNIPTRIQKLFAGEGDGLVVAKAAIDRILATEKMESRAEEFSQARAIVKKLVQECYWMVLPLSLNPSAAAQGALAIEAKSNSPFSSLFDSINCAFTYADVDRERNILESYGGGCHQKIGVYCKTREYGRILSLRGITDNGNILEKFSIERNNNPAKVDKAKLWFASKEKAIFERNPLALDRIQNDPLNSLFITKANALPDEWKISREQLVWVAGVETWKKLAKKGIWVSGTFDSLGEDFTKIDFLFGIERKWLKLSHVDGVPVTDQSFLPTYSLVRNKQKFSFEGKTHFFWSSASLFEAAWEEHPEIRDFWHFSRPGSTYKRIKTKVKDPTKIQVYLSEEEWYQDIAQ